MARFNLHSRRNVDPSFICKSGASSISATASANTQREGMCVKGCLLVIYEYIGCRMVGAENEREIVAGQSACILNSGNSGGGFGGFSLLSTYRQS